MNYARLTLNSGETIRVCLLSIVAYLRQKNNSHTEIYLSNSDTFLVKETPSEIDQLINKRTNYIEG